MNEVVIDPDNLDVSSPEEILGLRGAIVFSLADRHQIQWSPAFSRSDFASWCRSRSIDQRRDAAEDLSILGKLNRYIETRIIVH